MKSKMPKVLHEVMGKPMIKRVIDTAYELGAQNICVVTGHKPEYSTKERLIPPTWKENIKTYSAWTLPECGLILVAHRQPFRRAFQYDFFSCFIDSINVCSIDQNTFMALHNFRIINQL